MIRRLLFHNFYTVYRIDQWFKRRFTPTGMLLLGTLVASAVYGINTRATLSYQLFCLVFALLGAGIASAWTFRARFSASRRLPRYASVGERVMYDAVITCQGRRRQRGLSACETLGLRPVARAELARAGEPRHTHSNWFDRKVGYPRWASLMRLRKGASIADTALPTLPPGRPVRVELALEPLRRGYVRLEQLLISRPDPLGIFKAQTATAEPQSLLVLPKRYPVSWVELTGHTRDRVGGTSQAVSIGGSEEFAALREYRPGDPLRHIHWRGWARLGTPVVKEFHDECFVRQALILDTFLPESGSREQFEEAVSVAASFACAAPQRGGALDLLFAGTRAYVLSAGQGIASTDTLLEALACVDVGPRTGFALLRDAVTAHAARISACVCVLLAWDSQRRELVARLRRLGVPVLALVVVDEESTPEYAPGPMSDQPQRLRVLRASHLPADLAALLTP